MSKQTVNVRLDPANNPGVVACGPYRAGETCEVDVATGLHLVDAKGFSPVGEADAERLEHARREAGEQPAEERSASAPEPEPVTDPYADFLEKGVRKIRNDLDRFTAGELRRLVSLEEAGQNRPGAIKAMSERLESLGE